MPLQTFPPAKKMVDWPNLGVYYNGEQKANISMASLPLLLDCKPKLVGIARLASQGETLRKGREVEYFTLPVRSLLNRCTGVRMPFTWTINPYRGCEFACKYCYARYTHEFMELRDGVDFEQKIFVKQHAADLLRQELRHVKPGEEIAIGTATDPYQPAERRFEVTRTILEELTRHRGLEIGIVTKSNLVLRDIELLQQITKANRLFVNITITTLKADLARILEPRAPRPDLRLEAMEKLNQCGIAAGVICAPVLPGITDSPRDLEALVQATARAGGKYIHANSLFLKPCSAAVFMPFLEKEFPQLVESYQQRYKDRAFLSSPYRKRLSQLMKRLRQKHCIPSDYDRYSQKTHPGAEAEPDQQLKLF
jgi:DNA repair photolyase